MLEKKTISMRHPDNFEDLLIERTIEYTLTHNGNPVEIKRSSMGDLTEHYILKGWKIDRAEEYINLEGNVVYRGHVSKPSKDDPDKKTEMLFYIEKVF